MTLECVFIEHEAEEKRFPHKLSIILPQSIRY